MTTPRLPIRSALRHAALTAVLLGTGGGTRAQPAPVNVQFDRLSVQDGLSTTTVAALLQDRAGFLWVGTELGLDRYDGYGFTSFRHDPDDTASLSSSFAAALAEGPGGTLWVGTYGGGLNRLDPATGRAVRMRFHPGDARSLSDDRVEALRVDRRGRLWAGTGVGLDLVDPATGRVRRFGAALRRAADAKDGVYVRDLALAPNGDLWVASLAGLFRFDTRRGRVRLHLGAEALGGAGVLAVHVDRDGTVWAGLDGQGLVRVDSRTGAVTPFRHDAGDAGSLCADAVHDVTRDRSGVLWVASNGGGVCRLDASGVRPGFVAYRTAEGDPHSLSTDGARVLYPDRGGLLWVGTWGGGLNKARRTPFELFRATPADGFRSPDVMTFAEAPGGRMWVGTYDAGLVLVDPAGRALPVPGLPSVLASGGVRSVVIDQTGALWATSDDVSGLWRRSAAGRWSHVPFPEGAAVRRTTDLALGPDGTVWISAYGPGLCRADPVRLAIDCPAARFPRGRRLSGTEAYAVFPDADGSVWVSLWGVGLDRVDPARGRLAHYANDPERAGSLSQNNVTAFARDRLGRLWMGTYGGGLNRLDAGPGGARFHHVGVADGLPDGAVYAIVPDGAGHFWLTTNRGIARFDPVREGIEAYGVEDGLQSDEFNTGAALRLSDGRIVVGGIRGYNRFDPRLVRSTAPPPPVAVTAVRVMGAPRDLPPGGLRLRHDETAVAFELAALDYTAPARNLFAYRLDGLDAEWTKAGTRREAAYTNLPPGPYTLRVRAASSDGVWNEGGLAVPFEIRPAWWQTWPFRVVLGLALLGGLVAAVRYASQRRLRAEVARLDAERRIQDERARISRDLHDHVGAQLSSLLAGVELARLARRKARGSAAAADEALAGVEADARETMVQLRESIWALHESSVTLGALRDRLDADVRHRLRGRSTPAATVTLDAPPETALGPEQALHLYRIAREAVTNSLKHAGAQRLDVRIGLDDHALLVEVRDDGLFRPPGSVEGDGAGPSGFGIDSMRARSLALGARFEIETDAGTTVRVTVPAEPAA
jgi:signal transduction histidine kinase/ligand-binding sensor domain-containing protein